MICNVTLRDFELSPKEKKFLQKRIAVLKKKFINFTPDIVRLSIIMKNHEKNKFCSGVFTIHLPVKSLTARAGGHSVEEVISTGFEKLEKSFASYKGKRFKGSSDYPYRDTLQVVL